jgi:hypothetical protein
VSCLCGAEVRVDPMNRNRDVTCRDCGNTFSFAVTMDQGNRNSRVSLILPSGAFKPEGESLAMFPQSREPEEAADFEPVAEEAPAPPPPPPKSVARIPKRSQTIQTLMGHCECGSVFPLQDTGELTSIQSCNTCQRSYHVIFKLEPGTRQKTAIIVPTKPLVHRRTMIPAPPPKPPKGATKVMSNSVAPPAKARTKVGNTRVMKPAKPRGPVEVPPGAQAVACSCGETFIVRRRDVGQELACSGCGRKARFEERVDPQTLAPIIRIKPG